MLGYKEVYMNGNVASSDVVPMLVLLSKAGKLFSVTVCVFLGNGCRN